ncbi:MAG: acyl--CoA ligase, partial [Candidatus Krumholzibacteriota bacterium]|nr:acyl--CoA ligase [Candidatus Krumholzibacteriota bacterium]
MAAPAEIMKYGTFGENGIKTLPDIYDNAVEKYGTAVAMKKHHPWGYQSISFQEFGKLLSFLGAGLIDSGLRSEDRVVLMAENSPEWTLVYAAVTSCGGIIVPVDVQLTTNELNHLLLHCQAGFLIVSPRVHQEILEGMHLGEIKVIVIGEPDTELEATTLGQVMAAGKEKINSGDSTYFRAKADVKPEQTAALCYTSGTTGQPKGAVLLHSCLVSNIESIKCRLPITAEDTFLSLLPLHHTLSTMCVFLTPLASGSTIAFGRSMKSRIIMEDIAREGVTILVGVPLLFEHLAAFLKKAASGKSASGEGFFKRLFSGIASATARLLRRKRS